MKKIMVFGVFDILHEGHRDFLRQAKALGDYLIVAAAQDNIVNELKARLPRRALADRMRALRSDPNVDEVVEGDAVIGAWGVVRAHRPDVVAFGHDQHDQRRAFEKAAALRQFGWPIAIALLDRYERSS